MLTARVASAAIFFVLFFLGLFHSAWGWALPTVLAGALISGIYEFIHFGPRRPPLSAISLAMAGALTLLADAYWFDFQHALAILALLTVCSIALEAMVRGEEGPEMAGRTLLSVLYVGLPLALIILIWRRGIAADENNGEHYLIFLVLVTWSTDIGAYCIGRLFGRHKLAPRLSPGKTIEGSLGGVAFTILTALGLKLCWDNFGRIFPSWGEVLLLALVFSVLGPLGDLCESRFKRLSGVKDSGKTFTGHGGMLDIIDSLLFTTIFYYGYLLLYHPEVFI